MTNKTPTFYEDPPITPPTWTTTCSPTLRSDTLERIVYKFSQFGIFTRATALELEQTRLYERCTGPEDYARLVKILMGHLKQVKVGGGSDSGGMGFTTRCRCSKNNHHRDGVVVKGEKGAEKHPILLSNGVESRIVTEVVKGPVKAPILGGEPLRVPEFASTQVSSQVPTQVGTQVPLRVPQPEVTPTQVPPSLPTSEKVYRQEVMQVVVDVLSKKLQQKLLENPTPQGLLDISLPEPEVPWELPTLDWNPDAPESNPEPILEPLTPPEWNCPYLRRVALMKLFEAFLLNSILSERTPRMLEEKIYVKTCAKGSPDQYVQLMRKLIVFLSHSTQDPATGQLAPLPGGSASSIERQLDYWSRMLDPERPEILSTLYALSDGEVFGKLDGPKTPGTWTERHLRMAMCSRLYREALVRHGKYSDEFAYTQLAAQHALTIERDVYERTGTESGEGSKLHMSIYKFGCNIAIDDLRGGGGGREGTGNVLTSNFAAANATPEVVKEVIDKLKETWMFNKGAVPPTTTTTISTPPSSTESTQSSTESTPSPPTSRSSPSTPPEPEPESAPISIKPPRTWSRTRGPNAIRLRTADLKNNKSKYPKKRVNNNPPPPLQKVPEKIKPNDDDDDDELLIA